MTNTLEPRRIHEKLAALRAADPDRRVFGAYAHRYELEPKVSARAMTAFEKKWRVTLPEDYRRFLTEIGNGGAGPAYGLFRLGEDGTTDARHGRAWRRRGRVGDLAKSFPYARAWNLPKAFWKRKPNPTNMTPAEEDRAWATWDREIAKIYCAPCVMNGAVPVAHLGCALVQWLVVTGPCAGQIWDDNRVDDAGVAPLVTRGRRETFVAWYDTWLDKSLASARRARTVKTPKR